MKRKKRSAIPYRFEQFSGEKFTLKKSGYVMKKINILSLGEKDSNIKLEKVEKQRNTVPTDVRVIRTRDSVELGEER